MPIFIDEVVISVDIQSTKAPSLASPTAPSTDDKQALIAECVERVLEVLAEREER